MDLAALPEDGYLVPQRIAAALRTTGDEVARTVGLGRDCIRSDRTQRRLREMLEILNELEPRLGAPPLAYAWYRSAPLPGFDGWTAMQLVRAGRAGEVLESIDAVDAGVHA